VFPEDDELLGAESVKKTESEPVVAPFERTSASGCVRDAFYISQRLDAPRECGRPVSLQQFARCIRQSREQHSVGVK
jgi:hypothetical protein